MRRRAPNGFTLLELLLAISLVSIITGSILGGLHIGRRAWETAKASEAIDEVEGAARAIANQIAKSFPLTIPAPDQTPIAAFAGAPDFCRFVGLSEGGGQWGGLILTEIGGETVAGGRADIAVWTRVFREKEGLSPPRGEMTRAVILQDVASFSLSYFGQIEKGRFGWTDNWRNRPASPQLVTVKLGANRIGRVVEVTRTVALRQQ
ncbi:MAG: prepilin-type N-terminal cleavage/methylation domain-containing protein [Methylocystis sp.]|nr:prepilin-type N-terminal cleavage/methylation domain-containing protein [Methylocystis sp.]